MAILQRKIDNILREWKVKEDKKPLVIKVADNAERLFPSGILLHKIMTM